MKTFFSRVSLNIFMAGILASASNLATAHVILGDPDEGGIDYDFTFELHRLGQWQSTQTGNRHVIAGIGKTDVVGGLDSNGWGSTSADKVLWAKVDLTGAQHQASENSDGTSPKYLKLTAKLEDLNGSGLIPAMTAWMGSHDLDGQNSGEGDYFPNKFQEQTPFWFANGLIHGGELMWDADEDGDGVAMIHGLIPAVSNGLYDYVTLALGGDDWGSFEREFRFSAVIEAFESEISEVPIPGALLLFASGLIGLLGFNKNKPVAMHAA